MTTIPINNWTDYKSIVIITKALQLQMEEKSDRYEIFAGDESFVWSICLLKNGSTDVVDFETNYKATANQRTIKTLSSGAATAANQTTANTTLSSILSTLGGILNIRALLSTTDSISSYVDYTNTYGPTTPYSIAGQSKPLLDGDHNTMIRGEILTDEGTFRDDFSGSNLNNQRWNSSSTGNSTISVSNSLATLNSGTGSSNRVSITTTGDYGPLSMRTVFSLSQRIANQTIQVGFADVTAAPAIGAYFEFTGTSNSTATCVSRSSSAASDIQTTTITIPNGTSSTSNEYYIEVQPDQVNFIINGALVANHKNHIPGPYDVMNTFAVIQNSATTTTTALAIEYYYFINQNSLQINNSFQGDDLITRVKSGVEQTYSASATFTAANSATDFFTITGSASKTVKIKKITVVGTQTTAGIVNLVLLKRSTANSGGTSTAPTKVPHDSFNPAATATVLAYTANPTIGSLVGNLHVERLFVPTTTGNPTTMIYDKGTDINTQDVILRGTNEILAVNLNGVTVSGNSFAIKIEWSEV